MINLKLVRDFINDKKFLLVILFLILSVVIYKLYIQPEMTDISLLKDEIEIYETINIEEELKSVEIENDSILKELQLKNEEKDALKDQTIQEPNIKNNRGFVDINSSNTLYFLSELADKFQLKLSDYQYQRHHIDTYIYGDYQDLFLFFHSIQNLSDSLKIDNFKIESIVVDSETNVPSNEYVTADKVYNWTDGKTTAITEQLPLFFYEDSLEQKAFAEEKVKELEETRSTKINENLNTLISKYNKSKNEVQELLKLYAKKYEVPASYVFAVAETESNFNYNVINYNTNGTVDRGVMQINSGIAPYLAKALGIDYLEGLEFYPDFNIEMGVKYLRSIMDSKENPDLDFIFTSYSKGVTEANKLYEETGSHKSDYSIKAIEKLEKYKLLDEGEIIENPEDYKVDINSFRNELSNLYNLIQQEQEELHNKLTTETLIPKVGIKVNFIVDGNYLFNQDLKLNTSNINTSKNNPFKDENKPTESLYIGNDGQKNIKVEDEFTKYTNPAKEEYEHIKSEIKRAREVIKNRRILGLSIDNQLHYLNSLILQELTQ